MKLIKHVVLTSVLLGLSNIAVAYEYNSFGSEQSDCFAKAMIGMDSVINSRLGVPPEHALDLTIEPTRTGAAVAEYDNHTLNVILNAYLWEDTPHTYAVNVFFKCAQLKAYNKQALAE